MFQCKWEELIQNNGLGNPKIILASLNLGKWNKRLRSLLEEQQEKYLNQYDFVWRYLFQWMGYYLQAVFDLVESNSVQEAKLNYKIAFENFPIKNAEL